MTFVSASCGGEFCRCGERAVRKVGEEIPRDDPNPVRHSLTAYVCAAHFAELLGPVAAKQVGLAASTPVGGWEDISTAPRGGKHFLAVDECGDASRCAYHSEGYIMSFCGQPVVQPFEPLFWMPWPDAAPPPPSVSTDNGSRPQEAVPTEQAVPPVVDCWKVGDYAERIEDHPLVKAGEVHEVVKMYRGGYLGFPRPVGGEWNPNGWRKVATPQPADGSSNEGAGE